MGRPWIVGMTLVVACSSSSPTTFRSFDACEPLLLDASDATQAQQTSVDDATALWTAVGVSTASRNAQADASAVRLVFEPGGAASYGYYDDQASTIYINDTLSDADRAITIAHELGHAFGLVHVAPELRGSVMNPGNVVTAPTAADALAIAAIWGTCPN